ncbi:hypothetical protein BH10PSE12_BH10PSE12_13860 [soil metagenome]
MRAKLAAQDKVAETEGTSDRGYTAWKRAKIERGLTRAQDRDAMIPAEQVLRDIGFEG